MFCSLLLLVVMAQISDGSPGYLSPNKELDAVVEEQLASGPEGIRVGVWIGFAGRGAVCTYEADRPMPAASSIKAALLLELFSAFENRLDSVPQEAATIFTDAAHPAFLHYSPQQQDEVRKALGSATVAELGAIMIGTTKATNRVYNGAANLTIALLGGPKKTTARLWERSPQLAGLIVNRYMLAARDVSGDNTATPAALAWVYDQLATGHFPGITLETLQRARKTLSRSEDPLLKHFSKGGSLQSDPLTYVLAGSYESREQKLIYVVMGSAPRPDDNSEADVAYTQLKQSISTIQEFSRKAYLMSQP